MLKIRNLLLSIVLIISAHVSSNPIFLTHIADNTMFIDLKNDLDKSIEVNGHEIKSNEIFSLEGGLEGQNLFNYYAKLLKKPMALEFVKIKIQQHNYIIKIVHFNLGGVCTHKEMNVTDFIKISKPTKNKKLPSKFFGLKSAL